MMNCPPTFVLAVSVTVGGKQYLLGLYDTAGQVSVLTPGLRVTLTPFFRVPVQNLWKLKCSRAREGGCVCQAPHSIESFFKSANNGEWRELLTNPDQSTHVNPWCVKVFACVCLLYGAWCLGPNSC